MTQSRSDLVELLERHGLRPRKHLGQHFLADRNIVDKIVRLAGDPSRASALEIGSGTGTLTRALAERGFRVLAYEVDRHLAPVLEEVLEGVAVDLRIEDAANLDMDALDGPDPWVMVANLPYNVGTPLLLDTIRSAGAIGTWVVMVQVEVAERLAAAPGSASYGLPSVVCRMYGVASIEFRVPSQVFVPPPNVESAVVRIERMHAPDPLRERAVEIAAAGFGQRRKMLRSSLKPVLDHPVVVLESVGLDPTERAENLDAEDFLALATAEDR